MAGTASISHARGTLLPRRVLGDERLAQLAADGDGAAFEQIFKRHHQALYRYCLSILGHPEDAQDALQATMASALRALPGESRAIAIKPWLFRVAHNESISIVRRRRPEEGDPDEVVSQAGVEVEAESRERLRELVQDLKALPDRQRGALTMRELNGMSYEEIGSVLAATPQSARQMVYEARQSLALQQEGRAMECERVREAISAEDGRLLRGRKLRSHLRACDGCRGFEAAIAQRRNDLRMLSPALPGAAAAGILAGLLGGEVGGSVGGVFGASLAVKAAATIGAAVVLGTGTAAVVHEMRTDHGSSPSESSLGARHSERDAPVARGAALSRATASARDSKAGRDPAGKHNSKGATHNGSRHAIQASTAGSQAADHAAGSGPSAGVETSSPSSGSSGSSASTASTASNAGGAGAPTEHGSNPDLPPKSQGRPPTGSHAGGNGTAVAGANSNAGGNGNGNGVAGANSNAGGNGNGGTKSNVGGSSTSHGQGHAG